MNISTPPNLKCCQILCGCFSYKKLFKMYYSTKLKTLLYVSSFICLLFVHVQLFNAFEQEGFRVICTLVSVVKSKMGVISM